MNDYLFAGLKVLDVATVIAAPAAAMMLADFGADVIKIEQPGAGDMLRIIKDLPDTRPGAEDYMWQMDGRNKRGIALNLKEAKGIEILQRLVETCDVFITNQPYTVRESLGITYEALKPLRPDMIYASLTAYGEKGEERYRKGFDQLAYWARSGLMDLMRAPDTTPVQGLAGMGDHPTGVAIYAGIVTALLRRERTGEGAFVQTSLMANGLWSCAAIAQGTLAEGDTLQFRANRRNPPAMFKVYRCRDDRWLQFNMVRNEELLATLLTALERSELLIDPRFDTSMKMWENRAALGEEIAGTVALRSSDEWLEVFSGFDLPVNRVGQIEDLLTDQQLHDNRMVTIPEDPEMGVPVLVNHPIQVSSAPHVAPKRAPRPSEHADEILRELGFDDDAVARFREDGVID